MQKLVIGMRKNKGFTLIEILVVMVIIGITVGFALLAFGDFGESKRILFAAEQLKNTIQLAQQQAILENSIMGLRINNSGYQLVKYQEPKGWSSGTNRGIFKMYTFPNSTVLTVKKTITSISDKPALIIDSSGTLTPFTIQFSNQHQEKIALLQGWANGDLNLTDANK